MSLIESSEFRGEHATFSPSSPSWIHYTDEQFENAYKNKFRAPIGTEIHDWAAIQITLGHKCTSIRDMAKSIRTMIFKKNFSDRYGLSDKGEKLLFHMKYVTNSVYNTVKAYVNDCISYDMVPEECKDITNYSDDFFGTCDAFCYDPKQRLVRIFDLKTGSMPGKMDQLLIYSALFCLRNKMDPSLLTFDLRIYQNEEVIVCHVTNVDENESGITTGLIREYMDKIIRFNSIILKITKGGGLS